MRSVLSCVMAAIQSTTTNFSYALEGRAKPRHEVKDS
jgi:hypothetical protein